MPAPGYNFRAVRDINAPNGARAYNAGDDVPESAVSGPDAWLAIGPDVEPRAGVALDVPARNASQSTWAAFAVSRGADPEQAAGMSRADLIAAHAPDEVTAGG
jgi:hypothetical protein